MAHRRSSRRGVSDTQRRKKAWFTVKEIVGGGGASPGFQTSFSTTLTTPGVGGTSTRSVFALLAGSGTGADPLVSQIPEESTILRMRGSLLFPKNVPDTGGGPADSQFAVGFGVTAIRDSNADSYPAPISEGDWDGWMFLRQSAVSPVDSIGTMVDVKSMRKVKSGDFFFISFEASAGVNVLNTVGLWMLDLRILLLLP